MIGARKAEDLGGQCMASSTGFCVNAWKCETCADEECLKRSDRRDPKRNKACFQCKHSSAVFLGIECKLNM